MNMRHCDAADCDAAEPEWQFNMRSFGSCNGWFTVKDESNGETFHFCTSVCLSEWACLR